MVSSVKKTQIQDKPSNQYSRLQRLLSFGFHKRQTQETEADIRPDDFIDIVLEADFSRSGKVKTIK